MRIKISEKINPKMFITKENLFFLYKMPKKRYLELKEEIIKLRKEDKEISNKVRATYSCNKLK